MTDLSKFGELAHSSTYEDLFLTEHKDPNGLLRQLFKNILAAQRDNIRSFAFGGDGFTFRGAGFLDLYRLTELPRLTDVRNMFKNTELNVNLVNGWNWNKIIRHADQTADMFNNIILRSGYGTLGALDVKDKNGNLVPIAITMMSSSGKLFAKGSRLGDIKVVLDKTYNLVSVEVMFDGVRFENSNIVFYNLNDSLSFSSMFKESDLTNAEMKPEFTINKDADSLFSGAILGNGVSLVGTSITYIGKSMQNMFKDATLGQKSNDIAGIKWNNYNIDNASSAEELAANIIAKSNLEGMFDHVTLQDDLDISGWTFANGITMKQMAESAQGNNLIDYLGTENSSASHGYSIIYK